MERDAMNLPLLPFGAVFGGSIIVPFLSVIIYKWRKTRGYSMQVVATIKHIEVWLAGWYVTAAWMDATTKRSYTSRRTCIEFGRKQRVGDTLRVDVDLS